MWPPEGGGSDQELALNPYESFMKRHLQHYGYFTGRNQNYRNGFQQYNEWEKTYAYGEGSSCSSDSESDSDDDKCNDGRLQDDLMRTTQLIYSCESGRMVPKLREPRNLYALAKELGPQQAARWPSEIEVHRDRVHHMYHVPAEAEPFYKMTGTEKTPMCRGEENGGKVVFRYDPKFSFFMRSRVGGSRNGCSKCHVDLESDSDPTLIFESRFESGNLAKAIKVGDYDYELWMRYDLYTNKHTQWFYFRVTNMNPKATYRFTIVNFLKPDSLYNYGMRPCMYSDKEATTNKVGWTRAGSNIKYYRNNLKYETSRGDRSFYSLTWTQQFPHDNDTVYIAHCYPYTYSDLQDYLLELQNDPIKSRICKQRVLCRTLAGNLVYVLTITSSSQNPEDMKHKKAVVITSRVHPGESNSSWMMKGFLDYLVGNSADAKLLRDTFIFKIVPMLNPDGVIVGNYRCSLAGRDLNRNYKTVLKDSYPSVWHTKNMIRKLLQERDIIVYCDLHGHSRRQNVFMYGCEQRLNTTKRLHERIFPCMLHKNAPDKFSYDACKFKVQKSKEGTGRIVMWNMGIMNSFTMEATFCGSSLGKKKGFHFSVADYEAMGYHFCDTLLDYCDPDNSKYANILGNLENRMKMEILARFGQDPSNAADIHLSDYASDMESSDGGSDSSVSDGPPVHLQFNLEQPLKKKKKLKTRKDRDRVRQAGATDDPKKPAGTQTDEKQGKAEGSKAEKVGTGQTSSGKPQEKERYEEKQQKRQDYLQALTTAYLRNNIPLNKDPGVFVRMDPRKVVHFRYSERAAATGGGGGATGGGAGGGVAAAANLPFSLEGLCAHHGQTLAAQLAASSGGGHSPRPGPGVGYPSGSSYAAPVPDSSSTNTPTSVVGTFGVDDFVRSQIAPSSSITPLDRRPPSRPHLLEVSAAQQRQQDSLRERESSSARATPGGPKPQGKAPYRARVPSATAVSYKSPGDSVILTQPISLLGQGAGDPAHHHAGSSRRSLEHGQDGRRSRKGMREGDEDDQDSGPAPHTLLELGEGSGGIGHRAPRVKSAHTSQDMVDAMDGIRQLQHSLQQGAVNKPHSVTGTYIKQLIRETNDEIKDLNNEIDDKIEHKLQEARHQHHSTATSPSDRQQQPGNSSGNSSSSSGGGGGGAVDLNQTFEGHVSSQGTQLSGMHTSCSESNGQTLMMRGDMAGVTPMELGGHRGTEESGAEGRGKERSGSLTYQQSDDRKRVGSAVQSTGGREEYVRVASTDGGAERPCPPRSP